MTIGKATPVTYGLDPSTPRWSLARYQRMIQTGILTPDDKVELLENYIVLRPPRSPRHDGTVSLVTHAIEKALPHPWRQRILGTVVFEDSQAEPDISVVRAELRAFLERYPGVDDVKMIIEVADASLQRDQCDKGRIYARGGIPIYWIVNPADMRIEVYTQPSGPAAVPAYDAFQIYQPGDNVPLVLDGNTVAHVAVNDLLP
jgi:Uma2 family endonuclease